MCRNGLQENRVKQSLRDLRDSKLDRSQETHHRRGSSQLWLCGCHDTSGKVKTSDGRDTKTSRERILKTYYGLKQRYRVSMTHIEVPQIKLEGCKKLASTSHDSGN